MNRKTALVLARVAGYHQDSKAFTRIWVEARVSKAKLNEEWRRGWAMRQAGVPCTCMECKA